MDETRDVFPVKFNGEKYDLKKFMRDHPGGVNTLKNYKGKSILHAMQKFGHSNSAYHMMNDLKVDGDHLKDVNLTGAVSENGRIITSEENTRNVEEIKFLEELEVGLRFFSIIIISARKSFLLHIMMYLLIFRSINGWTIINIMFMIAVCRNLITLLV